MTPERWDIGQGAGACASCGTEFRPGEVRTSALYDERGELVRRDYCAAHREERPAP